MAPRVDTEYPYVQCRTLLHAWDEIPDDGGVRRDYGQSRTVTRKCFRCTRCAMLRYEAWSAVTGDLLFRDYRQPEDYHIGGGRIKRQVFRKMYLDYDFIQ